MSKKNLKDLGKFLYYLPTQNRLIIQREKTCLTSMTLNAPNCVEIMKARRDKMVELWDANNLVEIKNIIKDINEVPKKTPEKVSDKYQTEMFKMDKTSDAFSEALSADTNVQTDASTEVTTKIVDLIQPESVNTINKKLYDGLSLIGDVQLPNKLVQHSQDLMRISSTLLEKINEYNQMVDNHLVDVKLYSYEEKMDSLIKENARLKKKCEKVT